MFVAAEGTEAVAWAFVGAAAFAVPVALGLNQPVLALAAVAIAAAGLIAFRPRRARRGEEVNAALTRSGSRFALVRRGSVDEIVGLLQGPGLAGEDRERLLMRLFDLFVDGDARVHRHALATVATTPALVKGSDGPKIASRLLALAADEGRPPSKYARQALKVLESEVAFARQETRPKGPPRERDPLK